MRRPRQAATRQWPVLLVLLVLAGCDSSVAVPTTHVASPSPIVAASASASASASTSVSGFDIGPGDPWLLYGRHIGDGKAMFLVRPDGTDDHRLVPELGDEIRAFDWSPDGERIAFVYTGPGAAPDGEIWTVNADGTGAARLFDGAPECSGAYHPAWSPDGTRIAFVCYTPDGDGRLSTWDLATRTRVDLYRYVWPEHLDTPPRWSPDGSTIAFAILHWDPTNTEIDGSVIATVPASGGEVTRLTMPDQFFTYPSWRPTGLSLLVNDYDLGNMPRADHSSNLFELGRDGVMFRQITRVSVDGSVRIAQGTWDPSGDRIWVTRFAPGEVPALSPAWVDPKTGVVTALPIAGGVPQMRPVAP